MGKSDKENGGNVRRYRSAPMLNKINNEVYVEGKRSVSDLSSCSNRKNLMKTNRTERSKSFALTTFLLPNGSSTNEKAESAPLKLALLDIEQRPTSSSLLQVRNVRTASCNSDIKLFKDEILRINGNSSSMTQAYSVPRGPADPDGSAGAPLTPKNIEPTEALQVSCFSKGGQKKFHRHFKQVDDKERVLNYYSCALVGDILLQGHLYITENFFAFYSNVFGYVTKLLIPTVDVLTISKEKTAKIIPNAVGIATEDEKHVFGSLLSRDSTYKFMLQVWQSVNSSNPVVTISPPPIMKAESPSDDDSSASTGNEEQPSYMDTITSGPSTDSFKNLIPGMGRKSLLFQTHRMSFKKKVILTFSLALLILLLLSATYLLYKIAIIQSNFNELSIGTQSNNLYEDIIKWQSTLHSTSADKFCEYLNANLNQIMKVRRSLEALSLAIPKNKSDKSDPNSKWESTKVKKTNDDATNLKDDL